MPLQIIDEQTLARGLLVYNRRYLPLPAMTNWRVGLRLPLPIAIDPASGVATLHPTAIARLAASFDPAHEPALDRRAAALGAPNGPQIVTAARQFLADNTTPRARGWSLAARAITNAPAERPFVEEVFRQLGADGFGVALEFMNFLVNRQVAILAAQDDGALILIDIEVELGFPPANLDADRQRNLARANHMLGLVQGGALRRGTGRNAHSTGADPDHRHAATRRLQPQSGHRPGGGERHLFAM